MKLSSIRHILTITSIVLALASIIILVGSIYTIIATDTTVRVGSPTTQQIPSLGLIRFSLPISLHDIGLFDVVAGLSLQVLTGQVVVIENSTSWIVPTGLTGAVVFSVEASNATLTQLIKQTGQQPVLAFTVSERTGFGLVAVALSGQVTNLKL